MIDKNELLLIADDDPTILKIFKDRFFVDVVLRSEFIGNRKPNPKALFCVMRAK